MLASGQRPAPPIWPSHAPIVSKQPSIWPLLFLAYQHSNYPIVMAPDTVDSGSSSRLNCPPLVRLDEKSPEPRAVASVNGHAKSISDAIWVSSGQGGLLASAIQGGKKVIQTKEHEEKRPEPLEYRRSYSGDTMCFRPSGFVLVILLLVAVLSCSVSWRHGSAKVQLDIGLVPLLVCQRSN